MIVNGWAGILTKSVPPLISHGPLGRDSFPQGKPFYYSKIKLSSVLRSVEPKYTVMASSRAMASETAAVS